jgi:aspartate dehydrogenase
MKIGLIGVGTIGGFLVEKIKAEPSLELSFVLDTDPEKVKGFSSDIVINSIDEMPSVDLVVETASQQAVDQYAEAVLTKVDFLILSVGALSEQALEEKIIGRCKEHGTKFFIPSGAIAGIDMLKAMQSEVKSVELVSRKNPKGFGRDDLEPVVLFEGYAREACKKFPKNINISATASLNGIGFDKTKVKMISDPECSGNRHSLHVIHSFGEMQIDVKASPSKNPKTSSTAAYSAFDLIKKIQSGINLY